MRSRCCLATLAFFILGAVSCAPPSGKDTDATTLTAPPLATPAPGPGVLSVSAPARAPELPRPTPAAEPPLPEFSTGDVDADYLHWLHEYDNRRVAFAQQEQQEIARLQQSLQTGQNAAESSTERPPLDQLNRRFAEHIGLFTRHAAPPNCTNLAASYRAMLAYFDHPRLTASELLARAQQGRTREVAAPSSDLPGLVSKVNQDMESLCQSEPLPADTCSWRISP